jgi:hypothetical protein
MADFDRLQAENNCHVTAEALVDLTQPTTTATVGVTLTQEHAALLQSTTRFVMTDDVRKNHCSRIQKIIKAVMFTLKSPIKSLMKRSKWENKSEVELIYNKLDSNIIQAYISSSTVKSTDLATGEKKYYVYDHL